MFSFDPSLNFHGLRFLFSPDSSGQESVTVTAILWCLVLLWWSLVSRDRENGKRALSPLTESRARVNLAKTDLIK